MTKILTSIISRLTKPKVIGRINDESGSVKLGIQATPPIVSSTYVTTASKSRFGNMNERLRRLIEKNTHIGN